MGKIKTMNQDKQQEEETPKLKDGRIDFFKLIDQTFPEQIGVASYVKGLCKGYALDQAVQTAIKFKAILESGATELQLMDVIPDEVKPDEDKVTSKDIN